VAICHAASLAMEADRCVECSNSAKVGVPIMLAQRVLALFGMTISNWHASQGVDPVESSMRSLERRRRMKPVIVAIAIVMSMVLAFVLAQYYASTLPYPYGI
jgi:hypothetical protein